MKETPPHLPAKSCDIENRRRLLALPWFLFFIAMSTLAAVSASLVTVAWLLPVDLMSSSVSSVYRSDRGDAKLSEDPLFVRQTEERMFSIYDKRKIVQEGFYPEHAFVGQAVLLTSDGWAVTYGPAIRPGEEALFVGLDRQGKEYTLSSVALDNQTGLRYLKFTGEGFHIMAFAHQDDIRSGTPIWAIARDDWHATAIGRAEVVPTKSSYPIWQPYLAFGLESSEKTGAILLSSAGRLIGFVDNAGHILSSVFIDLQIPSLLSKGKVTYSVLPVQGYFVRSQLNGQAYLGFAVTAVENRALVGNDIQAGDVITAVQGKLVNEETLFLDVLSAPSPLGFTLIDRGGVGYAQKIEL